jgi:hypothetical protein
VGNTREDSDAHERTPFADKLKDKQKMKFLVKKSRCVSKRRCENALANSQDNLNQRETEGLALREKQSLANTACRLGASSRPNLLDLNVSGEEDSSCFSKDSNYQTTVGTPHQSHSMKIRESILKRKREIQERAAEFKRNRQSGDESNSSRYTHAGDSNTAGANEKEKCKEMTQNHVYVCNGDTMGEVPQSETHIPGSSARRSHDTEELGTNTQNAKNQMQRQTNNQRTRTSHPTQKPTRSVKETLKKATPFSDQPLGVDNSCDVVDLSGSPLTAGDPEKAAVKTLHKRSIPKRSHPRKIRDSLLKRKREVEASVILTT